MSSLKLYLTILKNHFADQAVVCLLDIKASRLKNSTQEIKVSAIHCSFELNFKCPVEHKQYQKYWAFFDSMDFEVSCTFLLNFWSWQVLVYTGNIDVPTNYSYSGAVVWRAEWRSETFSLHLFHNHSHQSRDMDNQVKFRRQMNSLGTQDIFVL